jgi:hypothetical protein
VEEIIKKTIEKFERGDALEETDKTTYCRRK